jgi:hypothetical protein
MADLKTTWIVVFVLVGLAGAMLFLRTSEELQPDLTRVHVAVQLEGDSTARVSRVEAVAGTSFRLFAVIEAIDWRGRQLYYTDAQALEIAGVAVPEEQLRIWDRREKVRILWFTVEGAPPYKEISDLDMVDEGRYREVFQADWPQAWTVPGQMTPAVENYLPGSEERGTPERFGTQRFHLRVEIFGVESDLVPIQRLRSPGAAQVGDIELTTVTMTLGWPLDSLSRVFGLPQVEPVEGTPEEIAGEITEALAERTRDRLLFSRFALLRAWLSEVELRWDDLRWSPVELTGEVAWSAGSAIRAGSKVAFTYADRGVPGMLDDADLCLDFDRGATVRPLGEVFVGEGLVELAVLQSAAD